jgi:hypothetical protein
MQKNELILWKLSSIQMKILNDNLWTSWIQFNSNTLYSNSNSIEAKGNGRFVQKVLKIC